MSCSRPGTPSSMNRACQRQTAVLLTPAVRIIAAVPSPSASGQHDPGAPDVLLGGAVVNDHLQALRSVGFKWTVMPVGILKARTPANSWESHEGPLCRYQSSRVLVTVSVRRRDGDDTNHRHRFAVHGLKPSSRHRMAAILMWVLLAPVFLPTFIAIPLPALATQGIALFSMASPLSLRWFPARASRRQANLKLRGLRP
ncbi:hypothetical protein [Rhizobium sp. T1473]|uniref:hypothetical protein n=1 Tax=unclassified Rhizobium TaxID=2613769 RepID=UPI001AAF0FE3